MGDSDILIVYYSQTGNTKRIAQLISRYTGGELGEIIAEIPYKSLYLGGAERVKKERRDGIHPGILTLKLELNDYNTVFLGTPNWGNGIAHPIMSFLEKYQFQGKTIYPFCTHGGGGLAHVARDIAKYCSWEKIGNSFDAYGDGGQNAERNIEKWLKDIRLFDKGMNR